MAKFTPSLLSSLTNETSAVAILNSNLNAISTAIENTLSRDGTSPNTMAANLDMNNYRILNLPAAVNDSEPVTKAQLNAAILGTYNPGREILSANRTYYVRTDGNNSNTGLTNTAGGAFLTIQKAIDVAAALDLSVYSVTIKIATGTYNESLVFKSYIGAGPITIEGDTTTPANVVLNSTAVAMTAATVIGKYRFGGLKVTATSFGMLCIDGSVVEQHALVDWGACSIHKVITTNATFVELAGCNITGAAAAHIYMLTGAAVVLSAGTINITGSPNFTVAFVFTATGAILSRGASYTYAANTATGKRYNVDSNGAVSTIGAGASFFPGSIAGTTANGGQYI